MKIYELDVEDFGTVTLMPSGEEYDVYNDVGTFLGSVNPDDYENWEDDEIILASIIEAELDAGYLGQFEEWQERDDA